MTKSSPLHTLHGFRFGDNGLKEPPSSTVSPIIDARRRRRATSRYFGGCDNVARTYSFLPSAAVLLVPCVFLFTLNAMMNLDYARSNATVFLQSFPNYGVHIKVLNSKFKCAQWNLYSVVSIRLIGLLEREV